MRVVIADDAALVRRGMALLLQEVGLDVVGVAADPKELYEIVLRSKPDVAIVDIRMPPTHTDEGIRCAQRIRAQRPGTPILLLSQYINMELALRIISNGEAGMGYLLKERVADTDELLSALHRIREGGVVVDSGLVAEVLERENVTNRLGDLTDRERTVLALVAEGCTDHAIATRLALSRKTVEVHITAIFRKLGLMASQHENRRVQATLRFLQNSALTN